MSGENEAIGGNGGPPAAAAEVVRGPATREDYAEAIREAYHQTVEGIFRMGDLLVEAKRELPHGAFGAMVEEDLPFSTSTARKLRRIARSDRLRNRSRVNDLPTAWGTLYELATLDDGDWERIAPHVSPDLTRAEIPGLVSRGAQISIMTDDARSARERIDAALKELPSPGERNWLKKRLQRVPLATAVRVAEQIAEADPEERRKLRRAGEVEPPPRDYEDEDVQLRLPGVAAEQREDILEWEPLGPPRIEAARAVLALQVMLRWAQAFVDRTDPESILAGLWVARSRRKVAADARRVADWLTEAAVLIEEEGD